MPGLQPSGARYRSTLQARSISRSVWETLNSTSFPGQIIAVYDRACTLTFPDGNVVSLVLPEIGNGPLNIVMTPGGFPPGAGTPWALAALQPGQEVRLEDRWLEVGEFAVSLDGAVTWEPRPNWDRLRTRRQTVTGRLAHLEAFALRLAREDSLLALLEHSCRPVASLHLAPGLATVDESFHSLAFEAALYLRAGWEGNTAQLQAGAEQLAGLGGGLTPAGDDFLSGVMLWTWLAHPDPQPCCKAMLEAAASRTTTLSAAFLRTAAVGECSASWHRLLVVLEREEVQDLAAAVEGVLSYGHTSGADTLAGFLWMGIGLPSFRAVTPEVPGPKSLTL